MRSTPAACEVATLQKPLTEEAAPGQGIENLEDGCTALLIALRMEHLLRLLAQQQEVDTNNLCHLFAPPRGNARSQREQLRRQRQPAQLRAPPPLGGADVLSVPRLSLSGVERSLEQRASIPLGSIFATNGACVRRHRRHGDTAVGDVSRWVEGEATLVGAAAQHG